MEKVSLCTVSRAQRLATLGGLSSTADEAQRASRLSHKRKGVWELRTVHLCLRPQTQPIPGFAETRLLWPGTRADTTEELLCLSTSEEDGNKCFSQRLSGEGEVDDRHPAWKCALLPEKT